MKEIKLSFPQKFPLLECDVCGQQYVILNVTEQEPFRCLEQAWNSFCPYCGEDGEREGKIGGLEELDNWLLGKEKYDGKENIDISDVRDMIFEIASDKGIRSPEN